MHNVCHKPQAQRSRFDGVVIFYWRVVMKVFEVTTEHCKGDSKEIITTVQYVTCKTDLILDVTAHFTTDCEQYEKDLKGIREVLTIVRHIEI